LALHTLTGFGVMRISMLLLVLIIRFNEA